jgi:hypothetical protein
MPAAEERYDASWLQRRPIQNWNETVWFNPRAMVARWLEAENKFKCPCHGSGYYRDGTNFEGPAPIPLRRAKIVRADDGQILIDTSIKFQKQLGEWGKPGAFLKYAAAS